MRDQSSASGHSLPPRPASWPAALAVGAGLVYLALYVWLEGLLPRGPQEFAYFPFMTEPLPFSAMRGFTFEQLARHLGRIFLLGPALLLLAYAAAKRWQLRPPDAEVRRRLLIGAVSVSLALTALMMFMVLEGRAIVDDELVYRQQAELLASGRLAEDTVPRWGREVFTVWTRIGATGKYLFGEPLVQVPGTILGWPALLHLLLAPLALWAWHRSLRFETTAGVASWATLLVAVSPMFILTNALALSHTTTFTCLTLAGLGYQWARERPIAGAALTGMALGFGLAVRPQVVAPIGLVIGLATLLRLVRRRYWFGALVLSASASFWMVVIAAYNRLLTGSALKLPWFLIEPGERFGFGLVGGVAFVHTPWTALENLLVTAVRFNGWWLGWPLSLGLIVAWLVLGRPRDGTRLWLLGGAALILFNAFYYSPGVSDTGPIYYFELLLPAAIVGAHAIVRALERWPRAVSAILLVHFAVGTTSFLWENVARLNRLVTTIHAPVEAALEKIEPPALLIHENHWRESMRFGWVWSYPLRTRSDRDPVVTLPRGSASSVPAMLKRYRGRTCWYHRYDPATQEPELLKCREARALLARKRRSGPVMRIPATAERLGFLDLKEAYAARRKAKESVQESPEGDMR